MAFEQSEHMELHRLDERIHEMMGRGGGFGFGGPGSGQADLERICEALRVRLVEGLHARLADELRERLGERLRAHVRDRVRRCSLRSTTAATTAHP